MTTIEKAGPRERLLRAAGELFYREGITATGVERLCQVAGVSKRSMYQLFETKDELVAQALERFGPVTLAAHLPDEAAPLTPRERILYLFERWDASAGDPEFYGCPCVNTATELKDATHPAALVARRNKRELIDFFARQATLGGARDPETLAQQLTVVFDGVAARTLVEGAGVAGLGVATAAALLDAGGLRAG
ncbi:TetR/AcrR family transcriptional regulator [Micromonospora sp. NPDC049559]|uniref:TetR/AcrR family transcriptional regulator n=1 Tax=Micromonospora sp. NPDC049559 TaxID=3155923 RepID=UPI0034214901